MSVISPVQSHDHEGSPMSKEEKLRWDWEGFVEKVGFLSLKLGRGKPATECYR